jgi:hypothetical protein
MLSDDTTGRSEAVTTHRDNRPGGVVAIVAGCVTAAALLTAGPASAASRGFKVHNHSNHSLILEAAKPVPTYICRDLTLCVPTHSPMDFEGRPANGATLHPGHTHDWDEIRLQPVRGRPVRGKSLVPDLRHERHGGIHHRDVEHVKRVRLPRQRNGPLHVHRRWDEAGVQEQVADEPIADEIASDRTRASGGPPGAIVTLARARLRTARVEADDLSDGTTTPEAVRARICHRA